MPPDLDMERDTSLEQGPAMVARRLRLIYFAAISAPIVLGATIAWSQTEQFDVGLFALSLVGGILLQAGATMTNDAFDLRYAVTKTPHGDHRGTEPPWLPQQVLQGALAFFTVGIMVGIYIAAVVGPVVLALGLLGVVSGLVYSVPPVRLAGTGLGELLAGINLSVVTTVGSYYVQAESVDTAVVAAALPGAFLLAGVLALNGFRADKIVEHRPLWRLLGHERAVWTYAVLTILGYGWLLTALGTGRLPMYTALAFLSLPLTLLAGWLAWRGKLEGAGQFAAYSYLLETVLLIVAYLL